MLVCKGSEDSCSSQMDAKVSTVRYDTRALCPKGSRANKHTRQYEQYSFHVNEALHRQNYFLVILKSPFRTSWFQVPVMVPLSTLPSITKCTVWPRRSVLS